MNVYLPSARKTQVEFRSHFFREKSASYGPGNTVMQIGARECHRSSNNNKSIQLFIFIAGTTATRPITKAAQKHNENTPDTCNKRKHRKEVKIHTTK
jgi:hypothetical protein